MNVRFGVKRILVELAKCPLADPCVNALFTISAILIYGRLIEMEQTKNYLSLSR